MNVILANGVALVVKIDADLFCLALNTYMIKIHIVCMIFKLSQHKKLKKNDFERLWSEAADKVIYWRGLFYQ